MSSDVCSIVAVAPRVSLLLDVPFPRQTLSPCLLLPLYSTPFFSAASRLAGHVDFLGGSHDIDSIR